METGRYSNGIASTFSGFLAFRTEIGLVGIAAIDLLLSILRPDLADVQNRPVDIGYNYLPSYDFIVVGGGSAGSVVASRLSEIANWNILLLEAGGDEPIFSDVPAMIGGNARTVNDWQVMAEPHEGYCRSMQDGRCFFTQGKMLGGSSVMNGMLYMRGNRKDYDLWETAGNKGWSYEDVLPYFLKSEDMRIEKYKNSKYHSIGGPLSLEELRYNAPVIDELMKAAKELGYQEVDVNGEKQTGFSRFYGTVRDGFRCSTSKAFLRPAKSRGNLHISMRSMVKKVLIDDKTKRAKGVLFTKDGKNFIAKASNEVILSAGAFRSAHLLLLSGIGPLEQLNQFGIPVVSNLSTGKNLQDHVAIGSVIFLIDSPISTVLSRMNALTTFFQLLFSNSGPMMSPGNVELSGFVHTKFSNASDDWPDIVLHSKAVTENNDGGAFVRVVLGLSDALYKSIAEPILFKDGYGIFPSLMRPFSRGEVVLQSANPEDPPIVRPNYFSDPRDLAVLIEGAKIAVKISETEVMQSHGARLNPYKVPACAKFEYSSDDYWACAAREVSMSGWHFSGTAKMGPSSDPDAVVDPRLRVYGVNGLRVVDSSIMPNIVTANTNAPIIMIAEKAVDMIKEDTFAQHL